MAREIGFVYVLQHDAMPGIYKVGMTLRSPSQRAAELSSLTGVPGEFSVACYVEVEDPRRIESHMHGLLCRYRIEGKEFFRCPLSEVIAFLKGLDDRLSDYFSDIAYEAMEPGLVNPFRPLWFETCLHDAGYLTRISRQRLGGAA